MPCAYLACLVGRPWRVRVGVPRWVEVLTIVGIFAGELSLGFGGHGYPHSESEDHGYPHI